jgi:hypothetical protein
MILNHMHLHLQSSERAVPNPDGKQKRRPRPKTDDSVVCWLKQVPDPVTRLVPVFWVPE